MTEPRPHGFIQFKGTNVCADLYCKCGAHLHADGYFLYQFQCPHCKRTYKVGDSVPLTEMTEPEIAAERNHRNFGDRQDELLEPDHKVTDDCGTDRCEICAANAKEIAGEIDASENPKYREPD